MTRFARLVIPGIPHHVTQRGNRRQKTFFCDDDYKAYLEHISCNCRRFGVEILAYVLMPNHVHLIAVPEVENSLRFAFGLAHEHYTKEINFKKGWTGYLWQGRFSSFPMDELHLCLAVKYVELNPVRAGLCEKAQDYPWSSAKAHFKGEDDILVKVKPMLDRFPLWEDFLCQEAIKIDKKEFVNCEKTGRPIGSDTFIKNLEAKTGRILISDHRGRKSKK